jgi:hypothetical protein
VVVEVVEVVAATVPVVAVDVAVCAATREEAVLATTAVVVFAWTAVSGSACAFTWPTVASRVAARVASHAM